jgi:2-dehydropantoate 2-reductase
MKIAIIGPGAMGCFMAASLCEDNEVWLLDHDSERANLLNRQGLILGENGQTRNFRVRATANPQLIEPVDLALLCVKAGQVKEVLQPAPLFLNRDSLLLAFQNGIGHLPLLPKAINTTWGLGITSHGSTLIEPGHVLHKGSGPTKIGFCLESFSNSDKSIKKLVLAAQTLSCAGIETEPVADILNHVWAKLLINVGINALTAINNCPNGALLESPETVAIMEAAILEGIKVAEKSGIFLATDPLQSAKEVCLATSTNVSSMLQDVRAKKLTEIDSINGALLEKAAELGVMAPVNEELVRKIKEIERNFTI